MSLLSDIASIASAAGQNWQGSLYRASFRGVPFAVIGGEGRFGRRVSVHEYPGRDRPYVEDMGRSTRRYRMRGFLVMDSLVYGGGSVMAQRDALVKAAEQAGPGMLIHPTLGELNVSIPEGGLSVVERWDMGRYFEISLFFIEYGERVFPNVSSSSLNLLDSLASALGLSAALDFSRQVIGGVTTVLNSVEGVIRFGSAVVGAVVGVVAGFVELSSRASRDLRNITDLTALLTGDNGRYSNRNVSSAFVDSRKAKDDSATMADLLATNTSNRAAVDAANAELKSVAQALDAKSGDQFTAAAQSSVETLAASIPDPGTAISLLGEIASYSPSKPTSSSAVGVGQSVAQGATSALIRRYAIAAMTRAVSTYAPNSNDEAMSTLRYVTAIIDAEILVAGNNGDDDSYSSLRDLRKGVVATLTSTGATLPQLQEFTFRAPMSSLAMASRLYGDASREDELVEQADPIHPAFMPVTVKALSS
ncbi:prophage DNA circulation protein [Pseudomonas nitritireducens]|uniref:Prophage DNA circulation protein n=1 Tax=Pseudomonas nitroreducens TaxID=46680 RepID=A0A7W7KIX8_PSENT|nr:DNA circularization N-terminal domain-containing protein [Pseudomonas nitritireducens]MBB4863355.1 prophage DNA circulation protein [Pseudomonas nitritireducens]